MQVGLIQQAVKLAMLQAVNWRESTNEFSVASFMIAHETQGGDEHAQKPLHESGLVLLGKSSLF